MPIPTEFGAWTCPVCGCQREQPPPDGICEVCGWGVELPPDGNYGYE